MISLHAISKFATHAVHKQHRHVAILLRGGAVVSAGWNHDSIHAERKALARVWKDHRPGLVLWSFRLTKVGQLAMARPCPSCQVLLAESGVKKVFYSDPEGVIRKMIFQAGMWKDVENV